MTITNNSKMHRRSIIILKFQTSHSDSDRESNALQKTSITSVINRWHRLGLPQSYGGEEEDVDHKHDGELSKVCV